MTDSLSLSLFYLLLVTALHIHHVHSFTTPTSSSIPSSPSHVSSSQSSLKASTANEGTIQVPRSDGSTHQLSYRIARPMSLSSRQAAPIVALHGGPSLPSDYLYPLEDVVPYRSILFYDQLGCGKSDEPNDISLYSIQDSVADLKALLKKLGVRRFHLYGQSYGGILAFEYMKSVACENREEEDDDDVKCLSAVLSSAPTDVPQIEKDFERLTKELTLPLSGDDDDDDDDETPIATPNDAELAELFRVNHQCRLPEMPAPLADAYANAGSVWRGTDAICDYVARAPPEDASRMPSSMILRGEYDFVSEDSVEGWREVFNTPFLRYKTLEGCSHHGLLEKGQVYGEIVDSYFAEYD
mmetsp:Transcript_26140/g.54566  ORF Transcript_26140/g.54566 Transcript_26140/m.54566 type:complete len:355 (+) Transcript_26140:1-1065(+)